MIAQYILGGLGILLSLILIGIGIYVICKGESSVFLSILLGITLISPVMLTITGVKNNPKPTKQDVIDGKAIYQETQVVTGNDTIKTYDIVWKQKN